MQIVSPLPLGQLLQHNATHPLVLNAELPFLHTAGAALHPLLLGLKPDSAQAHAAGTEGPGTIGGGNAVTVTVTVTGGAGGFAVTVTVVGGDGGLAVTVTVTL